MPCVYLSIYAEIFGSLQADFATSAVDFLHRVGRTARAGQFGVVTSLYTEANRDLVDAVRQAGKLGQPLVNFLPTHFLFNSFSLFIISGLFLFLHRFICD